MKEGDLMSAMKAAAVYPEIVKRFSDFKESRLDEWNRYVTDVREKHEYRDLLTRISWDLLRLCFTSMERCDWYRKYSINDNHITTAVRKAYVEVFGEI